MVLFHYKQRASGTRMLQHWRGGRLPCLGRTCSCARRGVRRTSSRSVLAQHGFGWRNSTVQQRLTLLLRPALTVDAEPALFVEYSRSTGTNAGMHCACACNARSACRSLVRCTHTGRCVSNSTRCTCTSRDVLAQCTCHVSDCCSARGAVLECKRFFSCSENDRVTVGMDCSYDFPPFPCAVGTPAMKDEVVQTIEVLSHLAASQLSRSMPTWLAVGFHCGFQEPDGIRLGRAHPR